MSGPRKLITYCVGVPVPRSSFVSSSATARSSLSLSGIKVTAIPSARWKNPLRGQSLACSRVMTTTRVLHPFPRRRGPYLWSEWSKGCFCNIVDFKAVRVIKSQLKIYKICHHGWKENLKSFYKATSARFSRFGSASITTVSSTSHLLAFKSRPKITS